MQLFKSIFLAHTILLSSLVYAQTKADLAGQIERQNKSIDSLKSVISNHENIIENRDRSIKFLQEDVTKLEKEKEELNSKIRQKNSELVQLRNQNKSGEAKRITLSNIKSTLTVPAGKYWVINQFIADYITDLQKDSLGNMVGKDVHVFLKSINNTILTDTGKNVYGPQIYSSSQPHHSIHFPIIFTETTTFSILVMKGNYNKLELYDGTVQCTYFEKSNQ